jgi:hypothetical protein
LRSVQLEPDLRSPGQGRRGEGRRLAAAVAQPGAEPLDHLGWDLLSGTARAMAWMSSVRMSRSSANARYIAPIRADHYLDDLFRHSRTPDAPGSPDIKLSGPGKPVANHLFGRWP